jgi:16S rRNA (guanine966-N2)-methyltransferase
VRVVGGEAKGRRLTSPPGTATRPTSDRVREAVFDMLASLDAVEGATVLDLFAGTGAMGIEALSRGAAHATFVDTDPAAIRAIEANLAATRTEDRATVVRADATSRAGTPADLAFADPPYAFDRWDDLLAQLVTPLAVVESGRLLEPPSRWEVLKTKQYGGTVVLLLRSTKGRE